MYLCRGCRCWWWWDQDATWEAVGSLTLFHCSSTSMPILARLRLRVLPWLPGHTWQSRAERNPCAYKSCAMPSVQATSSYHPCKPKSESTDGESEAARGQTSALCPEVTTQRALPSSTHTLTTKGGCKVSEPRRRAAGSSHSLLQPAPRLPVPPQRPAPGPSPGGACLGRLIAGRPRLRLPRRPETPPSA